MARGRGLLIKAIALTSGSSSCLSEGSRLGSAHHITLPEAAQARVELKESQVFKAKIGWPSASWAARACSGSRPGDLYRRDRTRRAVNLPDDHQ